MPVISEREIKESWRMYVQETRLPFVKYRWSSQALTFRTYVKNLRLSRLCPRRRLLWEASRVYLSSARVPSYESSYRHSSSSDDRSLVDLSFRIS